MKTSKRIVTTFLLTGSIITAFVAGVSPTASATSRVVVTGDAGLRVWVDNGTDVYSSFGDVSISIRAKRDCYATVYVVDTDGFVHVVYPFSPRHNAWIRSGYTYEYSAYELGLDNLYGRGIAYVFAVGSPAPFDYDVYGEAMFVGGYGYRISGDPYVACRDLYLSMLPSHCDWNGVSVSVSRIYIGEWVRYPSYLCHGHANVHVRVGTYCNACAPIYDSYRIHVADPHVVIAPRVKYKANYRTSTVATVKRVMRDDDRSTVRRDRNVVTVKQRTPYTQQRTARVATKSRATSRVVSTSSTVEASRKAARDMSTDRDVTVSRRTTKTRDRSAVKTSGNVKRSDSSAKRTTKKDERADKSRTAKKKAR